MKNFEVVDLVEQDPAFISEAKRLLEPTNHKGQFFNTGWIQINNFVVLWIIIQFVFGFFQFYQVCKISIPKKKFMMLYGCSGFWGT